MGTCRAGSVCPQGRLFQTCGLPVNWPSSGHTTAVLWQKQNPFQEGAHVCKICHGSVLRRLPAFIWVENAQTHTCAHMHTKYGSPHLCLSTWNHIVDDANTMFLTKKFFCLAELNQINQIIETIIFAVGTKKKSLWVKNTPSWQTTKPLIGEKKTNVFLS